MNRIKNRPGAVSALATMTAIAALFLVAASASATDFCTDLADPACPAGATFAPNIETAMVTDGNDTVADRIFIDDGTHAAAESFSPSDPSLFDDLEVIGAGREATVLTSNASTNVLVVNLGGISNREVTMRDLTIRVPASFPDGGVNGFGSAMQTSGDILRRVDIESRNPTSGSSGSGAVSSIINGGTFEDVRIFGSNGGGFDTAFGTGGWFPGDTIEINDSDVRNVRAGVLYNNSPGIPVHIRRSRIKSDFGTVLGVYNAESTIENSVIEAGEFPPFQIGTLSATSDSASLIARNNTILNQGGASTAFNVSANSLAGGSASAVVTDSIVFGFAKSWIATGDGAREANFEIRHSNFENAGTNTGAGMVSSEVGNISQTPLFVDFTDFRLSPESPSIDAGDPAPGGILEDIEGNVRPLDGNGDGTRVRDQGAYEAAEIPTCETDPAVCPKSPPGDDVTAPKVSKVKFKPPVKKKAASLKFRLSEAATVKVTFKPTPKGKGRKKRKTVKLTKKGKAGANRLRVRKGKLKPGRYRLTIVATDAARNKSRKVTRKVRVKPAKR